MAAAVKKESKNTMLRRRKVQKSGRGGGLHINRFAASVLFSISAKSGRAMDPLAPLIPPVLTSLLWFYHHASIEE